MAFPKNFLFGTANADHQTEAYDPEHEDIWDLWERDQGLKPRGKATDFWNRYEEDIAAAAGLGCKLFRFSIAWARVETSCGNFDQTALTHYRELADCILKHGMKPMVTLHHFVWPVWLERDHGGMLGEDFPDLFARYAEKVASALGPEIAWWVTFNEPSQLTFGYIKPWWQNRYYMPPGLPQGSSVDAEAKAVGKLIPNLFLAHTRARKAIKHQLGDSAQVGVNPLVTGFPIWLQKVLDWTACHRRLSEALFKFTTRRAIVNRSVKHDYSTETKTGWLNWAWRFWGTASLIANSNWWYLGISGRLAPELCPKEAIGAQDFVGLDYYWGLPTHRLHCFRLLEDAAQGRFLRAPVWPRGLYHALRRFSRWFPEQELLIIENGCPPSANNISRGEYMRSHLSAVEAAIHKGVPVRAYNWWSITSNREWGHPFDPNTDFGLYFVDLDHDPNLTRLPTAEADLYKKIIASHQT